MPTSDRREPSVLTLRQLNRATLARQLLLARARTTALGAIERVVGLQAQAARPPFVGLWSRVDGFRREELARLLLRRQVVRATLMRCTLHLMSAKDYLRLRAPLAPAFDRGLRSVLRQRLKTFEVDGAVDAARAFFLAEPRSFDELRDELARRTPKGDVRGMAYAARCLLPLVQVPTDDTWGFPAAASFAVAESWLGRAIGGDADPRALVSRYLAAFGPASIGDMQVWSGMPGLSDTFDALRPRLRAFRDELGRELFDLPKAPRPSEDTVAPPRFLPEFDNLVLAHEQRGRLIADEHRSIVVTKNLQVLATFLVDGRVAGTWKVERARRAATLVLAPFARLSPPARAALTEEGGALIRFVESDAESFSIRFR